MQQKLNFILMLYLILKLYYAAAQNKLYILTH